MKFTVLIPTHNNGPVIQSAIESVLAQPADFELFIVGDGALPETVDVVNDFCNRDKRIRFFEFPKGDRLGEAWRQRALDSADSDAVCYLSDDDIWFPNHLPLMATFLGNYDFCHSRHTTITADFRVFAYSQTLGNEMARRLMLAGENFFGLSFAGHRLDSYRKLNEGWSPGPKEVPSDLNMWQKWLRAEDMRLASLRSVTGLNFPKPLRHGQSQSGTQYERDFWLRFFRMPAARIALTSRVPVDGSDFSLFEVMADVFGLTGRSATI
jgi:GalNAc5-diNAcBac-PP-undecaprenol beta-1,3-glucosyltransferase